MHIGLDTNSLANHSSGGVEERASGAMLGGLWVNGRAKPDQLKRVAQARFLQNDWNCGTGSSAYSAAEQFYFLIEPDHIKNRIAAADFWISIVGDGWTEIATGDFVREFVEAASEQLSETQDDEQ